MDHHHTQNDDEQLPEWAMDGMLVFAMVCCAASVSIGVVCCFATSDIDISTPFEFGIDPLARGEINRPGHSKPAAAETKPTRTFHWSFRYSSVPRR
jgi:hypothetical protein